MPSLVDMLPRKRRVSDLPGYGQASPISEMIRGFAGKQPAYSVMQPDADELRRAGELGEQASVASQFYGALMPFAASAAAAKAGQGIGLSPLTVFHGSPHKFRKFDASKIGTGEGAQAYGHGLYFAQTPSVAKTYRNPEAAYQRASGHMNPKEEFAFDLFSQGRNEEDVFSAMFQRYGKNAITDAEMDEIDNAIKSARTKTKAGSLYTVDIPDEKIAQMLDWDKPIKNQPEVLRIIRSQINDADIAKSFDANVEKGISGANAMKNYVQGKTQADQSAVLQKLGVPGIRYLDQGSRGGVKGTSNFVVFPGEEQHLKMLEINNVPLVDMLPKVR